MFKFILGLILTLVAATPALADGTSQQSPEMQRGLKLAEMFKADQVRADDPQANLAVNMNLIALMMAYDAGKLPQADFTKYVADLEDKVADRHLDDAEAKGWLDVVYPVTQNVM